MPIYTFYNKKTNKEYDEMMSISEMEEFLQKNKHITQVPQPIYIVGGVGSMKTDGGWKDNLSRIAEAHPTSPLADRYGKKATKDIKTKQVVEKHRRRQRGKK
tara:strand:+ start:164 stop:469 length:306 start_codon:yes stop_codon:yes gene_type:complete